MLDKVLLHIDLMWGHYIFLWIMSTTEFKFYFMYYIKKKGFIR